MIYSYLVLIFIAKINLLYSAIDKDNLINSFISDIEKRNQKILKNEIKKTINEIEEDKLPPSIPLQIDDVVNEKYSEKSWSDRQKYNWEDSY